MVTTIPQMPTAPSRADDEATFTARADAWKAAFAARTTAMNAQAGELNTLATSAAAAAADGLSGTGASEWNAATSYTRGTKAWSPTDGKTYRRKTNGTSATDPSADTTNWWPIAGTGNVKLTATQTLENKTIVSPAYEGTPTDDTYTITDGSSVDIDPANGSVQTWTLGANRTPTAANLANGDAIELRIADGTAYAVTWSTINVQWVDNLTPTLPTSGYAIIELWKAGGVVYGAWAGNVA